jgi:hypothetical protein
MLIKATDSYNIGKVNTFLYYVVCASVIYTAISDVANTIQLNIFNIHGFVHRSMI